MQLPPGNAGPHQTAVENLGIESTLTELEWLGQLQF